MIFSDLLFVLLITLVLTAVFVVGFRKQRTGQVIAMFFIILFLATWAVGLWIVPVGPKVLGVPWVSYLIAGLLMALLLTALVPLAKSQRARGETSAQAEEKTVAIAVFDLFFWILVIGLLVAIILRYVIRNH
jgi:hypothetical protein